MKSVSIAGVAKSFGGLSVLSGVDLEVPPGSFTAILGPSGSGKTTLLRIIAGFERPDAGEVRLGSEVVDDAGHRFVPCERRRIGYVPQEGALFPHLSVGRNVAFGLTRADRRGTRVDELLELVGLAGLARRYPHQLSGGQQQRVALARALAPDPELVLLDEPFSSLDASLRASVRAEVHDVLRLAGATSILVTHDQDEALSMADQVAILRGGVIAQINTPSSLYRLPRDAELAQFLGEANLVEGTASGTMVQTALGELEMAPAPAAGSARGGDGGERGGRRRGAPAAGSWSWSAPSSWCSTTPARRGSRAWCAATSTSGTMPWCGCSRTTGDCPSSSCGSRGVSPSLPAPGSGSRCTAPSWCGQRTTRSHFRVPARRPRSESPTRNYLIVLLTEVPCSPRREHRRCDG